MSPDESDQVAREGTRWAIPVDAGLTRELSDGRVQVELHREQLAKLSERLRDLEGQDKMDNFQLQALMSDFNQAEAMASNVQKKLNDTIRCIIGKI